MTDARSAFDPNGQSISSGPFSRDLEQLVKNLEYRPGWTFTLAEIDRGQGCFGLTFIVRTIGYDSYHPEKGQTYSVWHYMPVPAAAYNKDSWKRWLFEQLLLIERHEAMEFFTIDGDHPYAPTHGPGCDPYVVRELVTDEARRTSFRGDIKPEELPQSSRQSVTFEG